MAVNVNKVEKLVGTSGPISFSEIRDEFGGNTANVRASLYRRNTGDDVDWDGPNASKIEPVIPDATENQDIGSESNWNVSALRNTVMEYNVTQSGNNEELAYFDSDTSTWNGNLSRNVLKKFDVTGTVYANQINKDALTFGGDLYNLEIEVDENGKIYGEGGRLNVSVNSVTGTSNVVNDQTNVDFESISGITVNVSRFEDEDVVFTERQPVPDISGSANVTDVAGDVSFTDNVDGATFAIERYIKDDQIDPDSGPKDAIDQKLDVNDVQGDVTFTRIEGVDINVTRFSNVPSSNPSAPIPAVNGTSSVTDSRGSVSISPQITGASAKITRWFTGDTNETNQKEGSDTITVTNDRTSISVGSNNLGATVKVTRDAGGATSSEGNAVGRLKYYVDVTGVIDPVVTGSTSTRKRASYNNTGITYSGINMVSGYPKKVSATRWEFSFDMANSTGFGRQSTFVYDFEVKIDIPAVVGGSEGQAVGSMGYYIDFDSALNNPSVSVAVVNTSNRASGSSASGTIRLVRLRKINSTRYEVTFDMANSITSGRQGTYVRSWSYTVTSDAVAGGTEGHPVGDLGYYFDIQGVEDASIAVNVENTSTRGGGGNANGTIKLVSGYPKKLSDTRWEIVFDMDNSLVSGRQATYVRTWSINLSAPAVSAGTEDHPVGSMGYYVDVVGNTVPEITDATLTATVLDTSTRASGLSAGGTIRLAPGYPKQLTDNRWDFVFDMANSVRPGRRQGTLVRDFRVNVSAPAISGGTEGHPVGSLGYYIDISGGSSNPRVTTSISDTNARASGLSAGDNSIRVVPGYPKAISDTRYEVAFDMTNSLTSGEKQATYAKFWAFTVDTQVESSGGVGRGGDALYVSNIRTNSPVEIYAYGSIFAGGGSGTNGNRGNSGGTLNCSSTNNFTTTNNQCRGGTDCRNLSDAMPGQTCRRSRRGSRWVNANPVASSIRNRCRGGGTRRGDGANYFCHRKWSVNCTESNNYNKSGGSGGNAGSGGRGRGFSYQTGTLSGNSGNSGNTNSCSGGSSRGNSGNSGNSGGDWGQAGSGSAGIAIQKKNAVMKSYTSNTVKGSIVDI
jgi:hypothetical protein